MSAKHAVLGLVIERPGYGYQLAQRLQERCGSWGWEPTGVYRALDSLAAEGFLRKQGEKGPGESGRGAPRVVYEATPEGLERFREWMTQPSSPVPQRQDLDLKLLFSSTAYIPTLLEQIRACQQTCVDELAALAGSRHVDPEVTPRRIRDILGELQVEREILDLEARMKWLRNAYRTLEHVLAGSQMSK
jgi:DNA-binding PadR family transcriptional regulator